MHTYRKKMRAGGIVRFGQSLYDGTWFVSFEKGGTNWVKSFETEHEALARFEKV